MSATDIETFKAALIIVDLQEDFLPPVRSTSSQLFINPY